MNLITSGLRTGILAVGVLMASAQAAVAQAPARLDALIVDGQSNHGWQETTAALRTTLLNTGRFTVAVSTTPPEGASAAQWAAWHPDFANYDVVLTGYKGDMWPESVRQDLEAYISGGGGLVLIHASLSSFITPNLPPGEAEWEAYGQMMALGWRPFFIGTRVTVDDATGNLNFFPPLSGGSASHGDQHAFVVKSRRPTHPIMAGLPAEWLHGKDELYHSQRGPAQNMTVLASAFSAVSTGGTGEHEPILWETPYGVGRVITTTMGHRWFGGGYGPPGSLLENGPDALHCVAMQTLIARSAEYAAGAEVVVPIPGNFPSVTATSVRDPAQGTWLQLALEINGQHPSGGVVVTPGALDLRLNLAPALWSDPLDLYFGYVVGGNITWFTASGASATPAPLAAFTPVTLEALPLIGAQLPPSTLITFVMILAEGSTVVSYDVISAFVPAGTSTSEARTFGK